jgi:hypothetical protein
MLYIGGIMNDNKLYATIIVAFFIMVCILVVSSYIYSQPKETIIRINPTPDIVIEAMRFHGITDVQLDEDNFLFFIRDGGWCALFNNGFRSYYAGKYGEDNG